MMAKSRAVAITCGLLQAGWLIAGTEARAESKGFDAAPSRESLAECDSLSLLSDLEEALSELQEAGVVPTGEELRLLLGAHLAESDGDGKPTATRQFSGRARVRCEPTREGGVDPRTNFRFGTENILVRGAHRDRPEGERTLRGSLGLKFPAVWAGSLDFRAGDLGYAWGYGLLSSSPGRSPSLAAGNRLLSSRNGPTSGGSRFDPLAVTGAALLGGIGNWKLGGLTGMPQGNEGADQPNRALLSLQHQGASQGWGALLSRFGPEQGMSLTGHGKKDWLAVGWESAFWHSTETGGAGRSWLANLGWAGTGPFIAEGLLAGSSAGGAPRGGRLPLVLPTADGRGWGVRAGFKPQAGKSVRVLWAHGQGIEAMGSVIRRERDLADLEFRWRVDRAFWISLRWRRKVERDFVWSERYPWETSRPAPESRRMVFSLAGGGQVGSRIYQFLFRSQSDMKELMPRTRKLVQVSGKWQAAKGWGCRAVWANAWGGDADLVSAVSPLSGFVLPRHWGHWQSEILLGVERPWFFWKSQAAFSRRIPVPGQESARTWSAWIQTTLSW